MNIKIDDLVLSKSLNKIILQNISSFDIELDTVLNQLILINKVTNNIVHKKSMNIKIDDLLLSKNENKIIINYLPDYDFEFNTILNELVLIKKVTNNLIENDIIIYDNDNDDEEDIIDETESDESENDEEDNNGFYGTFLTLEDRSFYSQSKGSKLESVFIKHKDSNTYTEFNISKWKGLLIQLYEYLTKDEILQLKYVKKINGQPTHEQKRKQKYSYYQKHDISLKSTCTTLVLRECLSIIRKKTIDIKIIYKIDNLSKEYYSY